MKNEVVIERFCYSEMGTFGTLTMLQSGYQYQIGRQLKTCELPWKNNERGVSCIPCGIYYTTSHMWKRDTAHSEPVPLIRDVPNRGPAILIHPGNTIMDIQGCILVGEELGTLRGLWSVKRSREAFDYLVKMAGLEFELIIQNKPNCDGWI